MGKEHSICWQCRNAVPNAEKGKGCEWSIKLEPVPNWKATKTVCKCYGHADAKSYCVHECPKFQEG